MPAQQRHVEQYSQDSLILFYFFASFLYQHYPSLNFSSGQPEAQNIKKF
jgi:hypothetical protein